MILYNYTEGLYRLLTVNEDLDCPHCFSANPCAKMVCSTNIVLQRVLTSLKGFTAHVYLTGNRKSMSNTLCLALPLQPVSCTLGEKPDFFTTPPDRVLDPSTQMSIWVDDCYSVRVHDPLSHSERGRAAKVLIFFFSFLRL